MKDYTNQTIDEYESRVVRLEIKAINFKVKSMFISIVQNSIQFSGLPSEDPNQRITKFWEICDTIKYNGASTDAIRLRLFKFSLRDKARARL